MKYFNDTLDSLKEDRTVYGLLFERKHTATKPE